MSRKVKYVVEDNKLYQLKKDGTKTELKGEKLFYAVGNAVTDNGYGREIVIVGIRSTRKVEKTFVSAFQISGQEVNISTNAISKETVFKLGHAICHPDDDFDVDRGLELAIRHAKSSKRELVANSYSLLGNDRCENIVKDEFSYISNNLKDYINGK